MHKIIGLVREHRESLWGFLKGLNQKKNSGERSGSARFKTKNPLRSLLDGPFEKTQGMIF